MKIVIAGGQHEAEYIVSMFHKRGNRLIVINPSREEANLLMKREHLPVYIGLPWKAHVLEEAGAHDADIFISLCDSDCDNYACCVLAKKLFGAKKCICVVNNPNNVELYKRLGIDSVISSTYLLGDSVRNESSVEDIVRAVSLENNQVIMIDATILAKFKIANKKIMDANFPKYASISCIIRGSEVIIPNGQVILRPKDKLMVVCSPEDQKRLTAFIKQEKSEAELSSEAMLQIQNPAELISPEPPKAAEKKESSKPIQPSSEKKVGKKAPSPAKKAPAKTSNPKRKTTKK